MKSKLVISNLKFCRRCKRLKFLSAFYDHPKNSDGKQGLCKICDKLVKKEWYKMNLERERKKRWEWQLKNRPKQRRYTRKYLESPRGKFMMLKYRLIKVMGNYNERQVTFNRTDR